MKKSTQFQLLQSMIWWSELERSATHLAKHWNWRYCHSQEAQHLKLATVARERALKRRFTMLMLTVTALS